MTGLNLLNLSQEVIATVLAVLGLILVDALLGVVLAISKNQFDVQKFPQFLKTNVLPYVGGLLILAMAAGNPQMKALFLASAAATAIKFIAEIKDKVVALFGPGALPPEKQDSIK